VWFCSMFGWVGTLGVFVFCLCSSSVVGVLCVQFVPYFLVVCVDGAVVLLWMWMGVTGLSCVVCL